MATPTVLVRSFDFNTTNTWATGDDAYDGFSSMTAPTTDDNVCDISSDVQTGLTAVFTADGLTENNCDAVNSTIDGIVNGLLNTEKNGTTSYKDHLTSLLESISYGLSVNSVTRVTSNQSFFDEKFANKIVKRFDDTVSGNFSYTSINEDIYLKITYKAQHDLFYLKEVTDDGDMTVWFRLVSLDSRAAAAAAAIRATHVSQFESASNYSTKIDKFIDIVKTYGTSSLTADEITTLLTYISTMTELEPRGEMSYNVATMDETDTTYANGMIGIQNWITSPRLARTDYTGADDTKIGQYIVQAAVWRKKTSQKFNTSNLISEEQYSIYKANIKREVWIMNLLKIERSVEPNSYVLTE